MSTSTFTKRMVVGGDWSEAEFRKYAKAHNISYEHYGFDRSQLQQFGKLPEFIRLTPDFVCTSHAREQGFLVECKGCGRGNVVKLKTRDLTQLLEWSDKAETFLFIYDKSQSSVSITQVTDDFVKNKIMVDEYEKGEWPDGSVYIKVPKSVFQWVFL